MDIMSKVRKAQRDIMSYGTKRGMEIMSKIRKADWDKMSNGPKKCQKNVERKQCRIRRQTVMSEMIKNVKVRKCI